MHSTRIIAIAALAASAAAQSYVYCGSALLRCSTERLPIRS